MAGLGFKDFQVGEVLTSSDVDGYLMQQAVMRFADSGARGSALGTAPGTAVALAEGMLTYRDDLNAVQVYDGTAWRDPSIGIGSNVVSTTKTDTFSTSATAPTDITGASVTITPSSSVSKILVFYSFPATSSAGDFVAAQLIRDSTVIGGGAAVGNRRSATSRGFNAGADHAEQFNGLFLDSPATTSATTYKLAVFGNGATIYVGRNSSNTDDSSARQVRSALTITAIEVAA